MTETIKIILGAISGVAATGLTSLITFKIMSNRKKNSNVVRGNGNYASSEQTGVKVINTQDHADTILYDMIKRIEKKLDESNKHLKHTYHRTKKLSRALDLYVKNNGVPENIKKKVTEILKEDK